MAGSFLMVNKYSAVVVKLNEKNVDSWTNISTNEFNLCNGYINCDFCVTDERCGFCSHQGDQNIKGFCLPVNPEYADSRSETGYCSSPLAAAPAPVAAVSAPEAAVPAPAAVAHPKDEECYGGVAAAFPAPAAASAPETVAPAPAAEHPAPAATRRF
uniref:PSI domain-containing protein n=1 Tax=Acrobeloides nanus TaxID=290746 RepID=A0A914DU81_9BILA